MKRTDVLKKIKDAIEIKVDNIIQDACDNLANIAEDEIDTFIKNTSLKLKTELVKDCNKIIDEEFDKLVNEPRKGTFCAIQ
jgi:hypothetical protein